MCRRRTSSPSGSSGSSLLPTTDSPDRDAAPAPTAPTEAADIDTLAALARLERAAIAAQARVTERLARTRHAREAAAGVPAARRGRGLANEVALAKRTSPHCGARDLGLATALVRELPHTLSALTRGDISGWSATVVARETAVLTADDRATVDREIAPALPDLGERQAAAKAREVGYRLDPGAAIRRTRSARKDRHVSLRPAPDTMTYLTGFLPVEQGVACWAALKQAADTARAAGDTRSRGQVMADTLVERLTGRAEATDVDVEVHLVMTDTTLLADDPSQPDAYAPAYVVDYGPVHAALARRIVHTAARVWLRRLFTRPGTSDLVATDARGRDFSGELRDLLVVRDQVCRTPWCDAPVRHADHPEAVVDGGETTLRNGQGLCEACNYAKQAPGWHATAPPGTDDRPDRHQVVTTTPTGHTHTSTAPQPPGSGPPPPEHPGDLVQFWSAPRTLDEELRLLTA